LEESAGLEEGEAEMRAGKIVGPEPEVVPVVVSRRPFVATLSEEMPPSVR